MSPIELTAETIVSYACFTSEDGSTKLQIECNYCSKGDYLIYPRTTEKDTGDDVDLCDAPWIQRLALHIQKHHPTEIL